MRLCNIVTNIRNKKICAPYDKQDVIYYNTNFELKNNIILNTIWECPKNVIHSFHDI